MLDICSTNESERKKELAAADSTAAAVVRAGGERKKRTIAEQKFSHITLYNRMIMRSVRATPR
jgi:hypothetical protein|eukprot:COSAG06_NODE_1325_length_9857_cov_11.702501_3_plen_63_part_00